MLKNRTLIRTRYADTDQMGYVYYGNYPTYFEVGRTELLRTLGTSYKDMEDRGVMLPVREMNIQYHQAAHYDDLLTIETRITERPTVRLKFEYYIYNESGTLLNSGTTTLIFVNAQTMKPIRCPEWFEVLMAPYFD